MEKQKNTTMINAAGIECTPELEARFNRWYDEVHIPQLLKTGEIRNITRLKRISGDDISPKYLILYKFENKHAFDRYEKHPAKDEATNEMKREWHKEPGCRRKWRAQYEVVTVVET